MQPSEPPNGRNISTLDRRTLLTIGAAGASGGLGLGTFTDAAAAWRRFDVDFRNSNEVWMIVENDLKYDPPAVAHVIVARNGEAEGRQVEFTGENATTVPEQYDDAPVVKYAANGTVLGVLAYNRPVAGGGRFSRPRCVMTNDHPSVDPFGSPSVAEADCVRAAISDHWTGDFRECWWEPIAPADEPTSERTAFTPEDAADGQEFGADIALNEAGDAAVIGAPGDDENGAAYVFVETDDRWQQQAKLTPDPDAEGVVFGRTVDINAAGDRAIVGAPPKEGRDVAGGAYVFASTDDGWQRTDQLRGEANDSGEQFGTAVAVDGAGDTALVGAPQEFDASEPESDRGVVYLFRRNTRWEQADVIFVPDDAVDPGDTADSPFWGSTVALSDDGGAVLLGNPFVGLAFGEVRAFTLTERDWTHAALVMRGAEDHRVGYTLELNSPGDVAVVGTDVFSPVTVTTEGFADIVTELAEPWEEFESDRLIPEDGEELDRFGRGVAIDDEGALVLIGSPLHDTERGSDAGAAYLYSSEIDEPEQRAKFTAADGSAGDRFGETVSLDGDGDIGAIGAPNAAENGVESGKVYVFDLGEREK